MTATTFLADLPEIGTLLRREISALAGFVLTARTCLITVAAHYLGRSRVRLCTWPPLLPAATIVNKAFYEKLPRAGKARKVALVACMRKLLVIINTMLKTIRRGTRKSPRQTDFN